MGSEGDRIDRQAGRYLARPGNHSANGDSWDPLFAIADLAGGDWPDRARRAAIDLSAGAEAGGETVGVQLLIAIRDVLEQLKVERLSSS